MTLRAMLFSKHPTQHLATLMRNERIVIDEKKPDVIICYGGDGTFLLAESRYPGVPKLLLRKSAVCNKCEDLTPEAAIPILANKWKTARRSTLMKLEVNVGGHTAIATNDIIIRNSSPMHALRFNVLVNGKQITKDEIGDGVVVATPFGSTGYYHSITRESFHAGIGIALNNTVRQHHAIITDESATIQVRIERGEAYVTDDTQILLKVKNGAIINVKQSQQTATIIHLSGADASAKKRTPQDRGNQDRKRSAKASRGGPSSRRAKPRAPRAARARPKSGSRRPARKRAGRNRG